MIKKIFFISFIIIFISGCNYTPIYSKKDQNFKLGKIETSGNTKLNIAIIRNINNFTKKNPNTNKIFNLKKTELELDVKKIECLINDRNRARKNKDWTRADQCRDELTQMGVVLEDTPKGTEWKIK